MSEDLFGVDDLIAEQALARRELERWQDGVRAIIDRDTATAGDTSPDDDMLLYESVLRDVLRDVVWWWAPNGHVYTFAADNTAAPPTLIWSEQQDPTTWTIKTPFPDPPPPLRNGLRRPRGYRERPRWQDRRQGRQRPWE